MDEQWSYVGHKKQQRWLWYAWQPHLKVALAYAFGSRADSTLKQLLQRLTPFKLALYCTDDLSAYERLLPEDKHLITKCLDPIDHKLYKFGKLYRARQVLRSLMTDQETINEHS